MTFNMNKRKNTVLEIVSYVQQKRPMVLAIQHMGFSKGSSKSMFQATIPSL